jgi:nucleoside-diphosphate-sugar epimerase
MEDACRAFSARYGIDTVCLRPPFVALPEWYRPGLA